MVKCGVRRPFGSMKQYPLHVQNYLCRYGIETLKEEFGIEVNYHIELPLVILNYSQLRKDVKEHPIVKECRGLVLEEGTWQLVAKGFNRFFNWGEVKDQTFNWNNFITQEKVDGSLVLIYFYEEWMANTRGSFGTGVINGTPITWQEGFCKALNISDIQELDQVLNRDITYVCEFCSPYNKVVREYPKPCLFLLAAFQGIKEIPIENCFIPQGFRQVTRHPMKSLDEILDFIKKKEETDPTYEGVVIRDNQFNRWKLKSDSYLALHCLKNNGNIFHPKNILPFVLEDKDDDLIAKLPETKEAVENVREKVYSAFDCLFLLWEKNKHLKEQKEFALAIKDQTPLPGILFNTRIRYGIGADAKYLLEEWKNSGDYILKVLF